MNLKNLKVVLLHDWLTGFRGGERVLEALCEMFPTAPLYTLIYRKGTTSPIIENRKIVASFLNRIPGVHHHYRKFLPLFPLAVESMDIAETGADLIISSSHCVIKGLAKKGIPHICYLHSPMRYIYDQFDVYFGENSPFLQRWAARGVRPYLQTWDRLSNDNVDMMVANSSFVRDRIHRFYQREAQVVHPFVDLQDFREVQRNPPRRGDFFLMVTAFAPNKRVDLAIQAFNDLQYPLKIVGGGQDEIRLKKMSGANIDFLGHVDRKTIVSLLSQARALIFPGVEDFGITPLEALAAGTPVVALRQGGVLETLHEGVATFFDEARSESLREAILRFEGEEGQGKFRREALHQRAADFSKERFQGKMTDLISGLLGGRHG